jgi:UTP--glucose-1-phosphate uridylyltransferase
MRVRKAVIPAAGLGTRVLPATKAVPKEMLPLADKPTIQYIVEEAAASGVEHVTIVTSRSKRAIENHFDVSPELEIALLRKGDRARLDEMSRIEGMARLSFVRQQRPLGLGHAVLMAKDVVGVEPFGVMLGDDLIDHPERPCLRQLIEAQERFGGSVLAVMRVPREQFSRYGMVELEPGGPAAPGLHRLRDVVEKPHPDQAPSDLAVVGRYVFSPNIFPALEVTPAGAGAEIQLTDAIRLLLRQEPVFALEFAGVRYDTGDPVGLLTTSLAYALKRPDLAPGIKAFLRTLQLD